MTEDLRRFDIGSGLSLELLPGSVLDFVFHPLVNAKLLGNFSDTAGSYSEKERYITWEPEYGVATKDESGELIMLAANADDLIHIRRVMEETNVMGIINSVEGAITDENISAEVYKQYPVAEVQNTAINMAITAIGPLIKICTVPNYTDGASLTTTQFIEDHTTSEKHGVARRRLYAPYTKNTGQGKVIAISYDTGIGTNPLCASHPGRIEHKLLWLYRQKTEGPFELAKRYWTIHKNANG